MAHYGSMIFNPESIIADDNPDDAGLLSMKAALRDLKVSLRKPREHPSRVEMLDILSDARAAIERINAPS